jgi:hypothetical protein
MFPLVAMINVVQFQCLLYRVVLVPILWILKGNDVATGVVDQLKLAAKINAIA